MARSAGAMNGSRGNLTAYANDDPGDFRSRAQSDSRINQGQRSAYGGGGGGGGDRGDRDFNASAPAKGFSYEDASLSRQANDDDGGMRPRKPTMPGAVSYDRPNLNPGGPLPLRPNITPARPSPSPGPSGGGYGGGGGQVAPPRANGASTGPGPLPAKPAAQAGPTRSSPPHTPKAAPNPAANANKVRFFFFCGRVRPLPPPPPMVSSILWDPSFLPFFFFFRLLSLFTMTA
jgi:hypothetical protein